MKTGALSPLLRPLTRPLARAVSEAGLGASNWWQQSSTPALFAADISLGVDKGYTAGTTGVGSVIDLSGNGGPLLPGSGEAVVATMAGYDAMTFDGGATKRAYFGANTALGEIFDGTPYTTFSLHHAVKLTSFSVNAYIMSLTKSPSGFNPSLRSDLTTNGVHASIVFSGADVDSLAGGPVRAFSAGDIAIKSGHFNGPTEKYTPIFNGYINNLEGATTVAGQTMPFALDRVNIGNISSTNASAGLVGDFAAAAVFGGDAHTLTDACKVHKGMLRRWLPAELKTAFTVFGYGQSNMSAAYTNTDPYSFTNGNAVGWSAANPAYFSRTNINHAYFGTPCSSPAVWFAGELQRILGGIAAVTLNGPGGLALAGGGINGAAGYLEPETAAGISAGATSNYTTRLSLNQQFAKLCDLTPAFDSERFRVMLFVGCESDVANLVPLKVGGVVPPADLAAQTVNIARALNNTFDKFRDDLGFTHFALCLTGRRGSTLSEVQGNEPLVDAVNAAYYQVAAERTDTYIVYEHNTGYNAGAFALDDLVVDADGAWVSGVGITDGVHYSIPQYKAIGITGARNFATALGYSIP